MLEKFGKFLDEIHGVMVVAVVLDPRYKMVLVDYFFPQIYGSDCCANFIELSSARIYCRIDQW